MKNKTIISALIIMLVIIVGGVVWQWKKAQKNEQIRQKQFGKTAGQEQENQASKNPIKISDWETYKNDEYGFEFNYPKNWELVKGGGDSTEPAVVSLLNPETKKAIQEGKGGSSCDLSFYYYDSIADEPENKLNNLEATTAEELISKNSMITRIGQIKLGNADAVEVAWGGNSIYYVVLVENKKHLYEIFFCNKGNKSELSDIDYEILSSFKFLN